MRSKKGSIFFLLYLLVAVVSGSLFFNCAGASSAMKEITGIQYPEPQPDSLPKVFLPGLISNDGLDFNSAFSPDGRSFYFCRSNSGQWDVYVSSHNGTQWSEPKIVTFSHPKYSEADPAFAPDGRLFFISNRPEENERKDTLSGFDVWFVKPLKNGEWSMPENFTEINSDSAEYYISFAKNGNAYFGSSRPGGFGSQDIYMSRTQNGKYAEPENLGPAINSTESEHDPLIFPEEDVLVFKSENRKDGFGEADLYVSKQTLNNKWGMAANLGSKFNTPTWEYCPYLTPDGKFFFYSSEYDIKWVQAQSLNKHIATIQSSNDVE